MPPSLFQRLFDTIDHLFIPPFKGAPILVLICTILLGLLSHHSPLHYGYLGDPDDYLYLVQAHDLMQGHPWFDAFQHRMDPPAGTYVHYANFLSGFYALFIAALQPIFGFIKAALIVSAVFPLLYLAAFLYLLRNLAQNLIDRDWGDLTAYLAFFTPMALSQFTLGHIDHHGLEVVLATVAFYGVVGMVQQPQKLAGPIIAGASLGFGLAIGLEILAYIGATAIGIALWTMTEGGKATRSGVIFGVSLFLTSLALLLTIHPLGQIFAPDIPVYSIVYVVLCGLIAVCFLAVDLAETLVPTRSARWFAGLACGAITAAVLLHGFPMLAAGPYSGIDADLARLIFANAPEAWPLLRHGAPLTQQFMPLIWPLLALAAAGQALRQAATRPARWLWAMLTLDLVICLVLAMFYQTRFMNYTIPATVLALSHLIWRQWTWPRGLSANRQLLHKIAALIVLLAGIVLVTGLISEISDEAYDPTKQVQTEMTQKPASPLGCNLRHLADLLNDPATYGQHPLTIINSINEGPELLFRTPHSVLSGPYHMNRRGNMDALDFFSARDDATAKAIAIRRQANLIVICNLPGQIRGYDLAAPGDPNPAFIQRLAAGQIPSWLKPVSDPQLGDAMLFEIKLSANSPP